MLKQSPAASAGPLIQIQSLANSSQNHAFSGEDSHLTA
jgi:hypothetical protein